MKQLSLVVSSALVLLFASCEKVIGDGPVVTENRNIVDFSGIDVRVSGAINYAPSSTYKVEVSAQQNILDVIDTYVSNGKLVVKFKNNVNVKTHEEITITINAPSVNSLRLSGSGNINATGPLAPARLDIDISGSGNIHVQELATGYLNANISGSGNITVNNGTASEVATKISGSGNINLTDLIAAKVTTTTSGSGETRVHATQILNATISGSGSVYYKGNSVVTTHISGSGRVKHM